MVDCAEDIPKPAAVWRRALPIALLAASAGAFADFTWNFPEPVTPVAHETLKIHNEFMIIITVLFTVVFAIMIYSMVKHRRSSGHQAARFSGPRGALQWFWVLVPFAILLFIDFILMGIPAVHALMEMEDTQSRADMVLKVTGMQWKWQYEYPDSEIKFVSNLTTPADQIANADPKGENYLLEVDNPVVLPVGKKVRVLLTSTDVIHTWWVPQFGVKRDAIPGFLRETWLKIDQPGTYRGQCAELCGKGHGFMPVVVEAVPEADYLAWVEKRKSMQQAAASAGDRTWSKDELMAKGKEVYDKICATCHQPDGKGLPGAFPAIAGSKVVNQALFGADGKPARDSHVDRVMNGKPGTAMQAFKTTLNDVELAGVITFQRNSFGNQQGDMIQPAQIKALR
ncbi:MAG TPA: cytochrome c oxidase subunit II [Rhodocyclaceae bacterium]|nr:cytochrome c oxidase subunit II [Rhodocyclaceae bacterium]